MERDIFDVYVQDMLGIEIEGKYQQQSEYKKNAKTIQKNLSKNTKMINNLKDSKKFKEWLGECACMGYVNKNFIKKTYEIYGYKYLKGINKDLENYIDQKERYKIDQEVSQKNLENLQLEQKIKEIKDDPKYKNMSREELEKVANEIIDKEADEMAKENKTSYRKRRELEEKEKAKNKESIISKIKNIKNIPGNVKANIEELIDEIGESENPKVNEKSDEMRARHLAYMCKVVKEDPNFKDKSDEEIRQEAKKRLEAEYRKQDIEAINNNKYHKFNKLRRKVINAPKRAQEKYYKMIYGDRWKEFLGNHKEAVAIRNERIKELLGEGKVRIVNFTKEVSDRIVHGVRTVGEKVQEKKDNVKEKISGISTPFSKVKETREKHKEDLDEKIKKGNVKINTEKMKYNNLREVWLVRDEIKDKALLKIRRGYVRFAYAEKYKEPEIEEIDNKLEEAETSKKQKLEGYREKQEKIDESKKRIKEEEEKIKNLKRKTKEERESR